MLDHRGTLGVSATLLTLALVQDALCYVPRLSWYARRRSRHIAHILGDIGDYGLRTDLAKPGLGLFNGDIIPPQGLSYLDGRFTLGRIGNETRTNFDDLGNPGTACHDRRS